MKSIAVLGLVALAGLQLGCTQQASSENFEVVKNVDSSPSELVFNVEGMT